MFKTVDDIVGEVQSKVLPRYQGFKSVFKILFLAAEELTVDVGKNRFDEDRNDAIFEYNKRIQNVVLGFNSSRVGFMDGNLKTEDLAKISRNEVDLTMVSDGFDSLHKMKKFVNTTIPVSLQTDVNVILNYHHRIKRRGSIIFSWKKLIATSSQKTI